MAKKPRAIKKRGQLAARPWLNRTWYGRLTRDGVLHIDLHAFDYLGALTFRIVYSWRGKHVVACDWYSVQDNKLASVASVPVELAASATWTRASHAAFRAVHGPLLALARQYTMLLQPGAVTMHCHYVPAPDWPALPKRVPNSYSPGARAGVTLPTRLEGELALARVRGTLPDVL